MLRGAERDHARHDQCTDQRQDALGNGRFQRLDRIGDAEQRQRRAVEVQGRDRDQPEHRGDQERRAGPRDQPVGGGFQRCRELELREHRRRERADQHRPRAADERAEVGPPERGAHAHVARQVAGIVGDVNRPRDLVRGRGEQLRQEGHGPELAKFEAGARNRARAGGHRHDHEHGQQQVGEQALGTVDDVVADRREQRRENADDDDGDRALPVEQSDERVGGEHLIEGVVADVGHHRHAPHQQRAEVAELRSRLDHLRQAELRALRRVECHEEGAERAADQHRDRHPRERAAERDADDTGGDRRQMRIAREPDRPQVPHLAVAFGQGHVVDRALFYECICHVAPSPVPRGARSPAPRILPFGAASPENRAAGSGGMMPPSRQDLSGETARPGTRYPVRAAPKAQPARKRSGRTTAASRELWRAVRAALRRRTHRRGAVRAGRT